MEIVGLVLLFVILGLYVVPYCVAVRRGKRNATAIGALNILLGWTVIGWVVAFVWALTEDDPTKA